MGTADVFVALLNPGVSFCIGLSVLTINCVRYVGFYIRYGFFYVPVRLPDGQVWRARVGRIVARVACDGA